MIIKPNHRPLRFKDIEYKKLGKECVIYSDDKKTVHVLNVTGSLIWHLSDGEHTVAHICSKIKERFDLPENVDVGKDVRKILNELQELKFIEIKY